MNRLFFLATWLAVPMTLANAVNAAELNFKSRVVSRGSIVLLGDVAEIKGANPIEVDSLKRVELFPAPSKGKSRSLRRREIRELLSLSGVDVGRHQITGAKKLHIAPRLKQPEEQPILEQPPKPAAPEVWFVTAARPLQRGEILRKADLTLQQQSNRRLNDSVIQDVDKVVDMELTSPLEPGQPLKSNMIRRPILVKRNELVTVICRAPGVQARITAKAMQQGSLGDLVLLQSLETREKYTGRVSGPKQAQVFGGGVVVTSRPIPQRDRATPRVAPRSVRP